MSAATTCRTIMRRQAGVIGRRQALSEGLSGDQVDRLLLKGAWSRLLPGVYLAAEAPLTWQAWAFAAVLSAGPGAVLVGSTAAALREWTPRELPIQVAVPPQRRVRLHASAITVLRLDVPPDDRVTVAGLPTTTRLRTAVDVAHLMPLLAAQQILDRMLVLGVDRARHAGGRRGGVPTDRLAPGTSADAERLRPRRSRVRAKGAAALPRRRHHRVVAEPRGHGQRPDAQDRPGAGVAEDRRRDQGVDVPLRARPGGRRRRADQRPRSSRGGWCCPSAGTS